VFKACLLEDTVQGAAWNVNVWVSSYGNDAALLRVLKMAVTASGARQIPAIAFDEPDCLAHFHAGAYNRFATGSTLPKA
jgi:hypothetical protein